MHSNMELEKNCEFCLILKPIVYCKADAAHLCLPCDARVHSANALSSRHPRTLVCEACRNRSAYVRCSDHRMFMCRGCNRSRHDLSSQHQRKVISCYMGCPSAKDFAALWGFDFELNQLEDQSIFSGLGSCSSVSEGSIAVMASPESQILRQVLELNWVQMNQGSGSSSSNVIGHEEMNLSSFNFKQNANSMGKVHENLDQQLQHSLDLDPDLQNRGRPYEEKPTTEPFPFVLPQMDGDSFWQCKSPVQSGQLWTQNMQDLGVCDDPAGCLDDFSMPDVDLTFNNIEELWGGEHQDATCSSLEKDMSIDKSDNGYERLVEDVSAASSICMPHSAYNNLEKHVDSSENINHFSRTKNSPTSQPSFSTLSFSHSSDLENAQVLDSKQNVLMRIKEKKKTRRCEKQSRYPHRKPRSEVKKPVRDHHPMTSADAVNVSGRF